MISRSLNLIFIHIPKCAGSSIETVFWRGQKTEANLFGGFISTYENRYQTGGLQHLKARQVRQEIGQPLFDACFKFAVVRNPYERTVSQYRYMMAHRPDLQAYVNLDQSASFLDYLAAIQRRLHVQWDIQTGFVDDEEGACLVDQIIRYERLKIDLPPLIKQRLGRNVPIPHKKKTTQTEPWQSLYCPASREIVTRIYAADLRRFEYEFPG